MQSGQESAAAGLQSSASSPSAPKAVDSSPQVWGRGRGLSQAVPPLPPSPEPDRTPRRLLRASEVSGNGQPPQTHSPHNAPSAVCVAKTKYASLPEVPQLKTSHTHTTD